MSSKLRIPVSQSDHSIGSESASLVMVEYGDYECPFCGRAQPVVESVRRKVGEDLRFVFRNFPLSEMHLHALGAARAAEAAAKQGKFWEMHGLLYQNQESLDPRSLKHFAAKLGLDMEKFAREAGSEEVEKRIERDVRSGSVSGVNGTPAFYINGFRFEGPAHEHAILEALGSVRATLGRHLRSS